MRLSTIARELELNVSTVHNILRTLHFEGVVNFDAYSKCYALGSGLVELAVPLIEQHDRAVRFGQLMQSAAEDLDATIALWRRVDDTLELVQAAESSSPMRITFAVGRRLPMLLGAMGRLVAARQSWPDGELRKRFDLIRWGNAPSYDRWRRDIDEARTSNVAVDMGSVNRGLIGIALPVEPEGPLTHMVAAVMFDSDDDPHIDRVISRLRSLAPLAPT
ncbi:hypothetical protein ASD39_19300 [Sphingomonas sp. Root50]|nr:hypothetical protein ASD17_15675 [Sphingomonas sp. Root1294]KQY72094.1 hypothetical protein ASD39_19300 [Sphingomonas sp. Root50]KRB94636.1 hypothetical protein ASE22_01455 [Sphingomonas sp. Root720]